MANERDTPHTACGNFIDRTWFNATVASLVSAGIPKTYIAKACGISRNCFRPSKAKTISGKTVEKLKDHLPELQQIARLPQEEREAVVIGVHDATCPFCGRTHGQHARYQGYCSNTCRERHILQMIEHGAIPPNHDPSVGLPSITAYQKGCRCPACRQPAFLSEKKARIGKRKKRSVPIQKAQSALSFTLSLGHTLSSLHEASGISLTTLQKIANGDQQRISTATMQKLEAAARHTVEHGIKAKPGHFVDARPFQDMVLDWQDKGLTQCYIARCTGLSKDLVNRISTGKYKSIMRKTASAILAHRSELNELTRSHPSERQMEMSFGKKQRQMHCPHCGKDFSTSGGGNRRYCSKACQHEADLKRRRGERERIDVSEYADTLNHYRDKGGNFRLLARRHGLSKQTLYNVASGKQTEMTKAVWPKFKACLGEIAESR